MSEIAPGWNMEVEEAAGWLVVSLANRNGPVAGTPPVADQVWGALEHRGSLRLIVDASGVPLLYSWLIGQLVLLHKRLTVKGGAMRLCGLSAANQQSLRFSRLENHFHCYPTREAALAGGPPPG